MKYNPLYVKQLEEIISAGLKEVAIPYQKGNSIRIKHMIVRKHSNGYRVFDCRCNKHIETVFCKTAAVAKAGWEGAKAGTQKLSEVNEKYKISEKATNAASSAWNFVSGVIGSGDNNNSTTSN